MATIREQYDVIVVGAGPAGSATAMILAEQGRSVLLVEKDRFPRYHVGESLTGTAGDFIARYGLVDEMAKLDFPSKPGVKVIGRDAKNEFFVPVLRPTWQVRRAEFDALLLQRAIQAGADYHQATAKAVMLDGERVIGLTLETQTDVVMWLLPDDIVEAVMKAIDEAGEFDAPGTGIAFTLGVEKTIGLASQLANRA